MLDLRPVAMTGYQREAYVGRAADVGLRVTLDHRVRGRDRDFHFAADADTMALYHCDETHGGPLVDSSGNGHHGQVMGALWVPADIPPEPSKP